MYRVRRNNGHQELKIDKGKWTRPVIYDGEFFSSLTDLAKKAKGSMWAISKALERGVYRGRSLTPASRIDVLKAMGSTIKKAKEDPVEVLPDVDVGPKVKEDVPLPPAPFIGIRWPDGAVTVRTAHGPIWSMTKFCMGEVPDEIKENCQWLG